MDDGGRALREERGGDGGPTKEADWWKHSKLRLLAPSDCPGEEEEDEVEVAVVTEEATSCSSEALVTTGSSSEASEVPVIDDSVQVK